MELIERTPFLELLQTRFMTIAEGEGHCVFISGESGIGKTSLVREFSTRFRKEYTIYQGTCDALFTPRPLAPLYDVAMQMTSNFWQEGGNITDRSILFSWFFHELHRQNTPVILIFEDIHWADEATLDFIKFLARRITQIQCLFILTYRDNEIPYRHPLRNVLGQLPPDSFTRLQLSPLSKGAVKKMAEEKGYNGEDVYSIAGGNPFYVTEILASYSPGIPESIKDTVLALYNRAGENARHIWDLMAVIPSGFEIKYLKVLEPFYARDIEDCLALQVIFIENEVIAFKHELYRRTIESSLSPLKRAALNKKILDLLRESFEENDETERIIHHAKNANAYEVVVQYAPVAAKQASLVGAHVEAAKLYLSAIEYYQGKNEDLLIQFYEAYAYECYLTNQVKEAINYTGKALDLWKKKTDVKRIGNSLRFLSRLWWLDGGRIQAENFAKQAIDSFEDQPSSSAKAMAYSNMSQLKMLCDQPAECITWGEKAIMIAKEAGDKESLSHALNNVGSVQMNLPSFHQKGFELLQQSLSIALKNGYHEHAARAYSNLGCNAVHLKRYAFAKEMLDEGIQYCEERDLDSWRSNMLSLKANLHLETGDWKKAYAIADTLLKNEMQLPSFAICALTVIATIKMRIGDDDALHFLLKAGTKAFETMELQRIIPTLTALLEFEWLAGKTFIKTEDLDRIAGKIDQSIHIISKNEFAFWLLKARGRHVCLDENYEGYDVRSITKARQAAAIWEQAGHPYAQAITLFEGDYDDKKNAILLVQKLGARAVYEKMKMQMRISGIKSIPRGLRKTTQSNPAFLTGRELDVLELLKHGMQNKEIASKLFISAKTVDNHISAIFDKLDVNSRIKAVKEAMRQEIIK